MLQHLIADRMTVGVVDISEVIGIDQQERKRATGALELRRLALIMGDVCVFEVIAWHTQ